MQGPKLKIVADCGDCEFLNYNRDYFICEKLSVGFTCILDKLERNPITPLECPFLEKSLIEHKDIYISEIKNSQIIRLKEVIKTIFSKNDYEYTYEEFTLTYVRILTGGINKFVVKELSTSLSDYNFKIISNETDVVVELIKES